MYIKDGIAYAGEPEPLYEDSAPVEEYDLKCYEEATRAQVAVILQRFLAQ